MISMSLAAERKSTVASATASRISRAALFTASPLIATDMQQNATVTNKPARTQPPLRRESEGRPETDDDGGNGADEPGDGPGDGTFDCVASFVMWLPGRRETARYYLAAMLRLTSCSTAPSYGHGMRTRAKVVLAVGVIGTWLLWARRSRASTAEGSGDLLEAETTASFYGPGFDGRLTANGEVFDQNGITAAHRTLPFGTRVRVTDLDNGRAVVVRVNDRGPFTKRGDGSFARSIDLSVGAAAAIGLDIQRGLARVRLERV